MTDAELSKKLGSYQRMESIGILLGVILVITGCIMMFVYRNLMVICILVFTGVALFLLVAKPAQTKKKALMQQELGGKILSLLGVVIAVVGIILGGNLVMIVIGGVVLSLGQMVQGKSKDKAGRQTFDAIAPPALKHSSFQCSPGVKPLPFTSDLLRRLRSLYTQ